jgi:hypothetical protein
MKVKTNLKAGQVNQNIAVVNGAVTASFRNA